MQGAVYTLFPRLALVFLSSMMPIAFWAPFEDAFKLSQFALLVAVSAVLIPRIPGFPPVARGGAAVPALALALAAALSGVLGGYARASDVAAMMVLAGGAGFLSASHGCMPATGKLVAAMAGAGALSACYSIFQFAGLDALAAPDSGAGLRPFSTMGNPDFMAAYMVVVIPLAVVRWMESGSPWWGVSSLLMFGALLLSQSRGAWLGFAGALVSAPFLLRMAGRAARPGRTLAAGLAILALGAGIFFAFHGPARERLSRTFSAAHFDAAGRLFMWRATMDMVRERPLLGGGPGSFGAMYPERHARMLEEMPAFPWFFSENSHNDFLQVPAELGLLGAGAWIWVMVAWCRMAWRRFAGGRVIALGFLLGFVALSIDSVFNFPWFLFPTLAWFWVSYAVLAEQTGDRLKSGVVKARPWKPALVACCVLSLFTLLRVLQANAWLKLAGDFNAAGRWAEGLVCAERSAERWSIWEGRSRAFNAGALAAYNLGDYTRSAGHSRGSLGIAPNMPGTLSQLGMTLARAGDLAGADQACRRAVELNPHQADAWHALGNIAFLRGDRKGARAYWERAVAEDPRLEGAKTSLEGLRKAGAGK